MTAVTRFAAVAAAVSAVLFQASALAEPAEQTGSLTLEEITVTAERREANLQDVPVAVSAYDTAELERRQAFNVLDVMTNVPNLAVTNNPGQATSTTIYLRGIGSTESIVTLDTGVAFYMDDVYFARQGVNNLNMFDVERVEVLRGPQGTLYGRNSSGGAVRVITKRPGDEFEAEVGGSFGEYDNWTLKGSLNVPLGENFAARFNAYAEGGNGYTYNRVLDRDVNDRDNKGGRAAFRWNASESVEVNFAYDYYRGETDGVYGYDIAGLTRPPAKDFFTSTSGDETYSIGETSGGHVTVDWAINDSLDFTSITGFRNIYQKWELDFTDQVVPIFKLWTVNDTDTLSQEFRLSGDAMGERLKYVVGAYYFDEDSYSFIGDQINLFISPGADFESPSDDVRVPLPFFRRYYDVDVESYAAFAEFNFDITDKLTLILGGRYTKDKKSLDIEQWIDPAGPFAFLPPGPVEGDAVPAFLGYTTESLEAAGIPMDIEDDDFSIKAGLQYQFTENAQGYFTFSQGYKSGGWSARTNSAAEFVVFDPEYVDSYELGLKTTVADGRARLNYTAYFYDYTDFFATATGQGGNFIVVNQDAEFYGFEFESTARLTDQVDVFASLGWQDGKYRNVPEDSTVGDEPQRMPQWTTKVGLTWVKPVGDDDAFRFTVDWNYNEDYFTNLQNTPIGASGEVHIWNALAQFDLDEGKYSVAAQCRNCLDNDYLTQSFDFAGIGFIQVYPGMPREWLVSFKAKF
jgi:iron complex outermembrane receptor protein